MEKALKYVRIVGLAAVLVLFVVIMLAATSLRPISDDYCHGAEATAGFFGAVSSWLQGWVGAFFPVVTGVLFVGLPLAFLPFGISSFIGFALAAASVGFMAVLAFRIRWKGEVVRNLAMVAVVTTFWILHLRVLQIIGTRPGDDPRETVNHQLAEILTHWQTVNVGYVLTPAISLILLGYGLVGAFSRPLFRLFFVFFGSLLAGQSGYVLGGSLMVVFVILIVLDWTKSEKRWRGRFLVGFCGTFFGILLTLIFPGTYARSDALGVSNSANLPIALRAMPHGISQWFAELFSFGSVIVLFMGAFLFILFRGTLDSYPKGAWFGFIPRFLLLTSAVFYIVNEAAEVFAYDAFYHFVPARVMTFVALILLGIGAMKWSIDKASVTRALPISVSALQIGAIALATWLLAISAAVLWVNIQERADLWSEGPASFDFLGDREEDYVDRCWAELEKFTSAKSRDI